jgi:hypothetical protein
MTAVVDTPMAQPNTMRFNTKGSRARPMIKILNEYSNHARAMVTRAAVNSLKMLIIIVAMRNSPGLKGLTKRFSRFLDQTSSKNEIEIPCWDRYRMSHRIIAPRKKARKLGSSALNWFK